ncbi:MAG TPA: M23 family metallopeptidase [Thermaerobacter sp.]
MERAPAPSRGALWLSRINAVLAAAWLGMVAGHLLPAPPGPQADRNGPVTAPATAGPAGARPGDGAREAWSWPLAGEGSVSSPFGPRDGGLHHGVDLAAPPGTPVRAVLEGTVRRAGPRGPYGLAVEIEHSSGWRTLYAHLSEIRVSPGQRVDKGAAIGAVGATGNATGPHLHLEVRRGGRWYDPLRYLVRPATGGDGHAAAAGKQAPRGPDAPAGDGARGGS